MATAARLAANGYKVTCFEANAYYGGKLSSFEAMGYRFDAGPSLFTLPGLVDDVFKAAGKDPRKYFNYVSKEVACHYFYADGTNLTAYAQPKRLAAEMEKQWGIPAQKINAYLSASEKKYNRVGKIFLEKSLHIPSTWLSTDVLKALLHLPGYHLLTSMNRVNERKLGRDKPVQYFNRYATYNGSNPYAAPGLLTMIPHLEHGLGTYLPEGGMQSIASSIYTLCTEMGVQFHFNAPVEEVLVQDKKAVGLKVKGEQLIFDTVVCNMDIVPAYQKLMPREKAPGKILTQERSSSALIFYWGIQKEFAQLGLHNILFSGDYKQEFEHVFSKDKIYEDPTVYINITSKDIKADAPAGCENWFVMVNVPANKNSYFTEAVKQEARQYIIKKINDTLNTDIEPLIAYENVLDPVTIQSRTGSLHGSLYGTSSNSRMAAFNRHANFSKRIKNLYFCGGSVHPGGGIPLCLNSAKIVSEMIN